MDKELISWLLSFVLILWPQSATVRGPVMGSPPPSGATPTQIAHLKSSGTAPFTSSSINTTGANFLAVGMTGFSSICTISDSNSNTWQSLTTQHGAGNVSYSRIYYVFNPTVGAGHTFTTAGSTNCTMFITAWSGMVTTSGVFDTQNGNGAGSQTACQTGSVTPSQTNELIFTTVEKHGSNSLTVSIDSSFSVVDSQLLGSSNEGLADATLVPANTSAVNPTWTSNAVGSVTSSCVIATFKHS